MKLARLPRALLRRALVSLAVVTVGWYHAALIVWAETPADQQQAIDALKRVRSNLQTNRDGTVRFLRLSKSAVTDEHLEHLRAFKQLDYLAVVTPTVSDAGLENIAELTNLDTLVLSDSGLTDQGLPHLRKLQRLEHLFLDSTAVSSAGLRHLEGLAGLRTLTLDETGVSDGGVTSIGQLRSLELLSLRGTGVTDVGLAALLPLGRLRLLYLDDTPITDAGLPALARLPNLQELSLAGTAVTLQGLGVLADAETLQQITLYRTEVQAADLPHLASALPGVRVLLDPPPEDAHNPWQRLLAGERLREAEPTRVLEGSRDEQSSSVRRGPDFQRHIVPLLGRLGCNGRTCHGSFQGQGGFRLSMFGYDFDADLQALTGGDEPRVNLQTPADSLILHKPTTEDHGGGVRFAAGGPEYQRLLDWIVAGAAGVAGTPQKLQRLEVTPREIVFEKPNQTKQLRTIAVWEDGSREDVTTLTRFQTNDDSVAEVSPTGLVTSRAAGDTWVISFYDNAVAKTQSLLAYSSESLASRPRPLSRLDRTPQPTSATNHPAATVDRLIDTKLRKLGITAADICPDETFLRRVSLDIAGTLPTAEQVRDFVADAAADKRARKIDELLQTPAYAQWWSMWLSDLTGSNAQHLGSTDMNRSSAEQWNRWLLRRVSDNVGWHHIAAGLILAESRRPGQTYASYVYEQSAHLRRADPTDFTDRRNPMHYYWFRGNNQQPADRALSFGYTFLGVRLQCAQCHKHPFDNWSQEDFDRFTQFFTRIKTGIADRDRATQLRLKTKLGVPKKLDTAALRRQMYQRVAAEGLPIPWNEIWIEPATDQPQPARLLGGEDIDLSRWRDPREPLVAWLLRDDNPYFAPAFVNRVWQRYFGVGIVDPPDDFNLANPPSNEDLLRWLSAEFIKHDYDLKWLHRTIANSRAYQRDWRPNSSNKNDERNFSRARVRRLPAEVTVDAIMQATASTERSESWAVDLASRKIAFHPISIQAARLDYSLLVFGKPLRTTNCDCERQDQPTLLQSLFVRNDQEVARWLDRADGWLTEMAQFLYARGIDQATESAYLRTLSRWPTERERRRAQQHFAEVDTPEEGLRDLLWALLNTREFLTNH